MQLLVSYLKRDQLRDETRQPWTAGALEWATSSPTCLQLRLHPRGARN